MSRLRELNPAFLVEKVVKTKLANLSPVELSYGSVTTAFQSSPVANAN